MSRDGGGELSVNLLRGKGIITSWPAIQVKQARNYSLGSGQFVQYLFIYKLFCCFLHQQNQLFCCWADQCLLARQNKALRSPAARLLPGVSTAGTNRSSNGLRAQWEFERMEPASQGSELTGNRRQCSQRMSRHTGPPVSCCFRHSSAVCCQQKCRAFRISPLRTVRRRHCGYRRSVGLNWDRNEGEQLIAHFPP